MLLKYKNEEIEKSAAAAANVWKEKHTLDHKPVLLTPEVLVPLPVSAPRVHLNP